MSVWQWKEVQEVLWRVIACLDEDVRMSGSRGDSSKPETQ